MDFDMTQLDSSEGIKEAIKGVVGAMGIEADNAKSYGDAIQIVSDDNFDARRIAIDLAKTNPDLFIELVQVQKKEQEQAQQEELWKEVAIPLMRQGLKIAAIKEVRRITGMGLKDSKDAVETLLDNDPTLNGDYKASMERSRRGY